MFSDKLCKAVKVGKLVGRKRCPATGPKIDDAAFVGSVIRKVVDIDPAAIPNGHEDCIGTRSRLLG